MLGATGPVSPWYLCFLASGLIKEVPSQPIAENIRRIHPPNRFRTGYRVLLIYFKFVLALFTLEGVLGWFLQAPVACFRPTKSHAQGFVGL